LRGKDRGTFIAFDSPQRDALLKKMKTIGINIGGSGESAVRLRPMLVFQKHHGKFLFLFRWHWSKPNSFPAATILLEKLEQALKDST
jgi:hypothetical protein